MATPDKQMRLHGMVCFSRRRISTARYERMKQQQAPPDQHPPTQRHQPPMLGQENPPDNVVQSEVSKSTVIARRLWRPCLVLFVDKPTADEVIISPFEGKRRSFDPVTRHQSPFCRLPIPSNRNTIALPTVTGDLYQIDNSGTLRVQSLSLPDLNLKRYPPPSIVVGTSMYPPTLLRENHVIILSDDHQSVSRLTPGEPTPMGMACTSFPVLGPEYPPHMLGASLTLCSTKLCLYGSSSDSPEQTYEFWTLDLDPLINVSPHGILVWKRHVPGAEQRTPPLRTEHSSAVNGNKVYIFGGKTGARLLHDTWEFNSGSNEWKELVCTGAPTIPRSHHGAVVIDDYMYVFGGVDGSGKELGNLAAMKISDPRWHDLEETVISPSARVHPVMAAFGTRIYIYGGEGSVDSTIHSLDIGCIVNPGNHQLLHCSNLSARDIHDIKIENPGTPAVSGGFGDVFVGVHRPTNLRLAMKRPRFPTPYPCDVDGVLRRLRREVEIWSSLQHPNILPFLGLLELHDHIYTISPWMERGNLANVLAARSHGSNAPVYRGTEPNGGFDFSFNETKLVQEIASAISFLHSQGVLHGDIRAKNVLLESSGKAVLCDFRHSLVVKSKMPNPNSGSIRWISPELFGQGSPSLKSEVYAFGMTIVEILTRAPPFVELNDLMFITTVILQDKRPSFHPVRRQTINFFPLWHVASLCWNADPGCRPFMTDCLEMLIASDHNVGPYSYWD